MMDSIVEPLPPATPSGPQIAAAVRQFCVTHACVILDLNKRSNETDWVTAALSGILGQLDHQLSRLRLPSIDRYEGLPQWFLLCEMYAYCSRHRKLTLKYYTEGNAPLTDSLNFTVPLMPMPITPASIDNLDAKDAETGEVIGDSVKKMIKGLPKWLQKMIEALIEASKILRLQLG